MPSPPPWPRCDQWLRQGGVGADGAPCVETSVVAGGTAMLDVRRMPDAGAAERQSEESPEDATH
eukprot:scaffold52186_cov29-Tisochrysis_lutea.AAC.7